MALPSYIIDQIRQSNNIVHVISDYVPLKKSGNNFKALCPFHQEKTPSFIVSPQKEIFHCFGCGEGGNVFNFLMKMEKISFMEAVEKLAARCGIRLPEEAISSAEASQISQERKSLFEVNSSASEFFHYCLTSTSSGRKGREYLKKRGLNEKIIDEFKLGYAPPAGGLMKHLLGKGYSPALLQKAGLIVFSEKKGNYCDLFFDRVIFPIFDVQSRVVGFGGRALGDGSPKYLNSPESPIFAKGKLLYGFNRAKNFLHDKNQLIIVEGYMDALACHQFGIENAVATLGTALTNDHIPTISRYVKEVVIIFDADTAGTKGTLRGLDLLVASGIRVKVVALPEGSDPDDFLRTRGREALEREVSQAFSLVDYRVKVVSESVDLHTPEGKVKLVEEVLPTIARIKNLVEQKEEIKKIANLISVDEETLLLELGRVQRQGYRWEESSYRRELVRNIIDPGLTRGIFKAEMGLVGIMLNFPDEIGVIRKKINPEDFLMDDLANIVKVIYELSERKSRIEPAAIIDRLASDVQVSERVSQIVASLVVGEGKQEFSPEIADSLIERLQVYKCQEEYRQISEELANLLDKGLPVSHEKMERFQELTRRLKGRQNEGVRG